MKTYITNSTNVLGRCARFLGVPLLAGLTVALMMPVVAVSQSLAPVNLGSAGNFVILAKSGISTVPTSAITGDIGVSPIDNTAITGFSKTLDSSGIFSTSSQVTGKIFASDYAVPTPSNLTTAVGDMGTAYTDAAGRSNPNFTELGAGEIGGLTLVPGLYKWGTNVLITTDVTLNGNSNDVWIFQIAGSINLANGKRVILTGGALPKNIFWQSFGVVSIGTTAHFEGIVLAQTSITLGTGASANGRLLAQTAVTLDANTVTKPTVVTAVENGLAPNEFMLSQNYPNPFNPSTTIEFQLARVSRVKLKIFDVLGREVATLINHVKPAGYGSVEWDASSVPSGVYFYRLDAVGVADPSNRFTQIRKMLLMR